MTDHEALAAFIALKSMLQEQFDGPSKRPFTFNADEAQIIIEAMEAAEHIAKPAIPEGMDVVERVARALMKARHPTWIWEDCGAYYPMFMEHARAALAAIKPEKERE